MHGVWHYFTCATEIDLKNKNYIIANTLAAYDQFKAYYGQDKLVPILIRINDGLRLHRAIDREDKQANPKYVELCRRFLADSIDFSVENIEKRNIQNFCTNNGTIDESLEQIQKIFSKHL